MAEKPIVVIKIGGSIADAPEAIAKDLASLQGKYSFIIAHGGSAPTNKLTERVGLKPQFLTSPGGVKWRYTNAEIIEIYNMATGGQASTRLVCALQAAGVNAIGLSGCDGKVVQGRQKITTAVDENGKQKIIRDDFTGKIEKINADLLGMLLSAGYVPVVAAVAIGEASQPLNIDGDRLAAALASAMHANMMISLTDVDGYYRNFPNDLVPNLTRAELDAAMKNAGAGKVASGGMKKKLMGCIEAIDGGVKEVIIGNGTVDSPIAKLLAGAGTHITKQ
jgi:[amino group carrier protein]-L-2-aminoadipate 6-kinase